MKASFWITFGWVGVGANGGLFPEVRIGVVALGCCRGAVTERLRAAIRSALHALGRHE